MPAHVFDSLPVEQTYNDEHVFSQVACNIREKGYCVLPSALPNHLAIALHEQAICQPSSYSKATVGRGEDNTDNPFVRRDEISWIDGNTQPEQEWLEWMDRLKTYLNCHLFLGLFSYDSHFAHYGPNNFYRKHVDAFEGEANRVLSTVCYLNPTWNHGQGGELILYDQRKEYDVKTAMVTPLLGTMVFFLSEEFPHEVLPTYQDRYSIAGWFNLNTSTSDNSDPPR